ncbi:MAG TPA: VCBS repeat-containing protein, partial [Candidatus Cloacimonadota bacterium]|nr:VCBS repeat-containing protein [Candidatus Cloacimonadota bacterium]
MHKKILLIICLAVTLGSLIAVNHLDLMAVLEGEFVGSHFGSTVICPDFNGDGYDDLVVKAEYWNPTLSHNESMYYGKIYFYWGGPGFDTTPDFVLEGQYHGQYASPRNKSPMIDAGDMNGDGFDDIVVSQLLSAGVGKTCVYYGRQVPQSMPDLEFSSPEDNSSLVYPLDDVNGDNLADVSLIAWNSNMDETVVYIWYGGDIQPTFFRSWGYGLLYGLGDVNGDGYGDCLEYYPVNSLMFYYGGEDFPADSLLILEPQINGYPYSPVGDCNGDGFADFMAR